MFLTSFRRKNAFPNQQFLWRLKEIVSGNRSYAGPPSGNFYIDGNNMTCTMLLTLVAAGLQKARSVLGEIREDEIGSCSPDGGERFEHDAFAVNPAIARSRHDHAVLSAHLIGS
jgi:hypothetical protein